MKSSKQPQMPPGLWPGVKMFLFAAILFAANGKALAQCPQLHAQANYSRIVNGPFASGGIMQADYDKTNDDMYLPTTYSSGTNEAYLTAMHYNGQINSNWGNRYYLSGTEKCMASKVTKTGEIAIAGTTQNAGGTNVLFVMLVQNNGTVTWTQYFPLATTDIDYKVLLTETTVTRDIVAVASASANHNILVRIAHSGILQYYDDHQVYASTNPDEVKPWINGIAATSDDGYVIVGSSGQYQNDFFAATAFKYDPLWSGTLSHVLHWSFIYRHQITPPYLLTMPFHQSSTIAEAVVENPNDQSIAIAGYQSDHDQNFLGESYRNGFILVLDKLGAPIGLKNFVPGPGQLVCFNGISMDISNNNYMVTGYVQQGPVLSALIAQVNGSPILLSPVWAYMYGAAGNSIGYNVFPTPSAAPTGYLVAALSDDAGVSSGYKPEVIAVDNTGVMDAGCGTAVTLTAIDDMNDMPALTIGGGASARMISATVIPTQECDPMFQSCGSECEQLGAKYTYSRSMTSYFNPQGFLKADYDPKGMKSYVPANYNDNTPGNSDIFWSKVDINSQVLQSKFYHYTGQERTCAVKKGTNKFNNVYTVGTTVNQNGKQVIFILCTDPGGNVNWFHQYDQTNANVTGNVVVTESKTRKDVIIAATSDNNDRIVIRLDQFGSLLYYDDHQIYAGTNTSETRPVINGIIPFADDGYIILGNTGQNGDYYAAVATAFDRNYNTSLTHTYDFDHVYRMALSGGVYNLSVFGQRSASVFNGGMEDPASGEIILVGHISNYDQNGANATFQAGITERITTLGGLITQRTYFSGRSLFFDFNDVLIDGGSYVITGSAKDNSTGDIKTLLMKIDISSSNVVWAKTYEQYGTSIGYSIFKNDNIPAANNGPGYLSIGVTNYIDFNFVLNPPVIPVFFTGGPTIPHVLSVDGNGDAGTCAYSESVFVDVNANSNPGVYTGPSASAISSDPSTRSQDACAIMFELCPSSLHPTYDPGYYKHSKQLDNNQAFISSDSGRTGVNDGYAINSKGIKMYPNPVQDHLNLEIQTSGASNGIIMVQDLLGRTVLTQNIPLVNGQNHCNINLGNLQKGFYLVRISNDKQTIYQVTKIEKD